MSVYVGRDVQVTIQVPVEDEEVSGKLMEYYSFVDISNPSTTHKASDQEAASEPTPDDAGWMELDDTGYSKISRSDDTRHSVSTTTSGNYALMLLRYKCGYAEADVKKIVVKFEGYGTAPAGNGVTMKIWDHVSAAWTNPVTGTAGTDETLAITLTANLSNYIDDSGYIYVLVRTSNPDDGTTNAVLYCDHTYCFVTRAKFTVEHTPISDRDMDGVADEPEHVTVKVNGSEVTVSSVDDDAGLVTLASGDFNEGDVVTCSYRYDTSPNIAQEITIEPKINIEGIDGLGSDTIQQWAVLLKEVSGSIKEVLNGTQQIERLTAFMPKLAFQDSFTIPDDTYPSGWTSSSWRVYGGWFRSNLGMPYIKDMEFSDFILEVKCRMVSGGKRSIVRFRSNSGYYEVRCDPYNNWVKLYRDTTEIASKDITVSTTHTVKVMAFKKIIIVYLKNEGETDFTFCFTAEDSTYTKGKIGLNKFSGTTWEYDDVKVWTKGSVSEYGIIISWEQAGSAVKIGLDGVVFPELSLPAPKNEPVYVETPFKARSIKIIT